MDTDMERWAVDALAEILATMERINKKMDEAKAALDSACETLKEIRGDK